MRLSAQSVRPGLLAAVTALTLLAPQSAEAAPAPSPLQLLARSLGTPAAGLTVEGSLGAVTRLGSASGHPFARTHGITSGSPAAAAARGFVAAHRDVLGTPATLGPARTQSTDVGRLVTLQQTVRGVPVLGGTVTVSLTSDNRVQSVSRHTTSQADPVQPSVITTADAATRTAIESAARAESVDASVLVASTPALQFYDPALLGVPNPAAGRRVWSVQVTSPTHLALRRNVLVDAVGGAIALQYSQTEQAKARVVCDAGDKVVDYTCPSKGAPAVASEASPPTAGADADVVAAYNQVGGVYDFYANVLGRDGIDGHGGVIASTVHVCDATDDCPMDNAFWNGQQLVFGDGFAAADDVVAHELTHGVTDATSGLFYFYQSGAIDESMSDVMGELYDQWNGTGRDSDGTGGTVDYRWMLGEDLPASEGVLRDMRSPTVVPSGVQVQNFSRQPDSMTSPLYVASVDSKTGNPIDSGGVHANSGVGNKAAELVVDGGILNGVHVHGLGGAVAATRLPALIKAAHLYYLVDQMLATGSDYADLAATLTQACNELVGHRLADGRGGQDTMTKSDCASVREAVAATRMTSNPKRASAPEAPTCTKGTPQSFGFRDNFENTSVSLWKSGVGWYDPQIRARGNLNLSYATSGRNELYGSDGDVAKDSSATMVKSYAVPIGKSSYLRFSQAYLLDYEPAGDGQPALYFDGGRVEYSRNGGRWTSAASLFDFGGYTGQITGYSADKQAYTFRGFGGDSHGYRSARLNLTKLAGSTVRFRFRLTADSFGSSYGWFIDDVGFYACGAKPSASKVSVVRGSAVASLAWAPPADHGTTALTRYVVTVADLTLHRTMVSTSLAPSVHKLKAVSLRGHRYRFTVTPYNKAGRGVTTAVSA
ncbi:MAG: bacillolysin [Frankiales bacterium]|jgi:Zn-dependent metalloprotease|nr:bacillolysin [Frankiales bacterium]